MIGKRGNQKLTVAQVKRIVEGCEKNVDLAREFGVTARAVANIKHGRSWKSINRRSVDE